MSWIAIGLKEYKIRALQYFRRTCLHELLETATAGLLAAGEPDPFLQFLLTTERTRRIVPLSNFHGDNCSLTTDFLALPGAVDRRYDAECIIFAAATDILRYDGNLAVAIFSLTGNLPSA
jgi:hypothetical protein